MDPTAVGDNIVFLAHFYATLREVALFGGGGAGNIKHKTEQKHAKIQKRRHFAEIYAAPLFIIPPLAWTWKKKHLPLQRSSFPPLPLSRRMRSLLPRTSMRLWWWVALHASLQSRTWPRHWAAARTGARLRAISIAVLLTIYPPCPSFPCFVLICLSFSLSFWSLCPFFPQDFRGAAKVT